MMMQIPFALPHSSGTYVDCRGRLQTNKAFVCRKCTRSIRRFRWQLGPHQPEGSHIDTRHKRQAVLPIYRWKLSKYLNVLKKRRLFTLVSHEIGVRAMNGRAIGTLFGALCVRTIFTMANKQMRTPTCLHKNKCHCKRYHFSDSFSFDILHSQISNTKRANTNFYTCGVTHSYSISVISTPSCIFTALGRPSCHLFSFANGFFPPSLCTSSGSTFE